MKRILIVDDDPDFVAMNRAVLETAGYEVITAGNANRGLEKVKAETPDLVLMDVMMGSDVAGFSAVEKIRALPNGKELPIIMITSFTEHHEAPWDEKPDRSWVDVENYLHKPVDPETLLQEVARLLG